VVICPAKKQCPKKTERIKQAASSEDKKKLVLPFKLGKGKTWGRSIKIGVGSRGHRAVKQGTK